MWKRSWIERRNCQTEEKKGSQSGLAEGKNEIAKNLIKLGLNVDDIVKATGLSKEEIEKLSKDK